MVKSGGAAPNHALDSSFGIAVVIRSPIFCPVKIRFFSARS